MSKKARAFSEEEQDYLLFLKSSGQVPAEHPPQDDFNAFLEASDQLTPQAVRAAEREFNTEEPGQAQVLKKLARKMSAEGATATGEQSWPDDEPSEPDNVVSQGRERMASYPDDEPSEPDNVVAQGRTRHARCGWWRGSSEASLPSESSLLLVDSDVTELAAPKPRPRLHSWARPGETDNGLALLPLRSADMRKAVPNMSQ